MVLEEDFEKFVKNDSNLNRLLIMSSFKRTYKLLVSMNLNIPIICSDWIKNNLPIFQNGYFKYQNIQDSIYKYFLKTDKKGKLFDQLKFSYIFRKNLKHGFLKDFVIFGNHF